MTHFLDTATTMPNGICLPARFFAWLLLILQEVLYLTYSYARPTAHGGGRRERGQERQETIRKVDDVKLSVRRIRPKTCSADPLVEEVKERMGERIRCIENGIRRIKKENEISSKILRSKKIDADQIHVEFVGTEVKSVAEEFREFKRKANKIFVNSSLPPSSDRPWQKSKKGCSRISSGKKTGGQIGHSGSTLTAPHEPEEIVRLYPARWKNCRMREECESNGAFSCAETRTVVDVDVVMTVTECRALRRGHALPRMRRGTQASSQKVSERTYSNDGVAILAGILDSYGAMNDKHITEVINEVRSEHELVCRDRRDGEVRREDVRRNGSGRRCRHRQSDYQL